jgi:hypothetical protein
MANLLMDADSLVFMGFPGIDAASDVQLIAPGESEARRKRSWPKNASKIIFSLTEQRERTKVRRRRGIPNGANHGRPARNL